MNYRVKDISINTRDVNQYSCLGSNISVPSLKSLEVDCTIEVYETKGIKSIEDFENFLKGHEYPWLSDDMLRDLLIQNYPERFL